MRRDELMKPDPLSELILLVIGVLMVSFLMMTGFFAFLGGTH
jgi:hypothetical protein